MRNRLIAVVGLRTLMLVSPAGAAAYFAYTLAKTRFGFSPPCYTGRRGGENPAPFVSTYPQDFEHLIKDVLERTRFDRLNVTRFSQDGGIDVNAFAGKNMWPVENLLVQVQAKRWLHSVSRREMADLHGSLKTFSRGVCNYNRPLYKGCGW